ncbi:stage II sporulation protein R [Caldanaerobius fijiensis DSM 17918]|uniref:Stage II sporulation protein R n=1 Tax=Caldanaerobius fijiensis DSM 17918 TaxID=1121256 RepID=A0A1M4Z6D5_9THEO|nr:stage II sporulation protein R [Caldanaerobius fijiensis]SHF13619.1 stage II sporulation protein R [Caldanaerobius fijiensis DSM 17918]
MKKLLIIILAIVLIFLGFQYRSYEAQKADISNRLIRLHVIANSDSAVDQAVKLKVRDAIIKAMDSRFEGKYDIDKARKLISDNLSNIQAIAEKVLKESGMNYGAKVQFGRFNFPIKRYGSIVLPPGNYEALKVVLGDGQGKNWWCVMFPPLCFADITHGLTTVQTEDNLSQVLSADQLNMIDENKNHEVVFKFKIYEVIERTFNAFTKSLRFALK